MYDALTDERSWEATGHFLTELFSSAGVDPSSAPDLATNPGGYTEQTVDYVADGVNCQGWVSYDPTQCTSSSPCPAVMIVPDGDGVTDYEKQRARLIADHGYVALAADIYGVDTPVATMPDQFAALSAHLGNATKYMNKMHGALTQIMTYDFVDTGKMAAMGYCFGGTGMIHLGMVGYDGFPDVTFPSGLLGVVAFHGGLNAGYASPAAGSRPKILIHSGGQDDSNQNIENLTSDLEGVSAVYEITRYGPDVYHRFTTWGISMPPQSAYDARADFRSWADTMDFFHEIFTGEALGTTEPTSAECPMPGADGSTSSSGSTDVSASFARHGVVLIGLWPLVLLLALRREA